ncbi:MAG: hypothetical protein IIV74_04180 [Alphaproteobacteria bacterium]|nr:hypothetical protein [Alphaproteobacteria bacterium]
MKTKIIYISGNEVFEMDEIRAAFDAVRGALGLDNDTVLFGVPVDRDCALAGAEFAPSVATVPENIPAESVCPENHNDEPEINDVMPVVSAVDVYDDIVEPVQEPEISVISEQCAQPADTDADAAEPEIAVAVETEPEKVIPILSILSANQSNDSETTDTVVESMSEVVADNTDILPVAEESASAIDTIDATAVISDVCIDTDLSETVDNADESVNSVTIGDMITEDAPVVSPEKTLEQLLESMTPLREDVQIPDSDVMSTDSIDILDTDDTDATLAKLATEFVDTQDKIPTGNRSGTQGKIGKLKNILPFKKMKREDTGLMGDLFGWAGVAANDEEYAIPGFFTPAASKKQGA